MLVFLPFVNEIADQTDDGGGDQNDVLQDRADVEGNDGIDEPKSVRKDADDACMGRIFEIKAHHGKRASECGEDADGTCPGQKRRCSHQDDKQKEPELIGRPFVTGTVVENDLAEDRNHV